VKQARELRDRADVLMRQAEVVAAELRDALKASVLEALRRLIQTKLQDGSLPHVAIREPVLSLPGDGSMCRGCDQQIATHHLMVMIPSAVTLIPLHATYCFELWDEERRRFREVP